jgi:hypothetical protein
VWASVARSEAVADVFVGAAMMVAASTIRAMMVPVKSWTAFDESFMVGSFCESVWNWPLRFLLVPEWKCDQIIAAIVGL